MSLPTFAVARLGLWSYVRFALDHVSQTARQLETGPREAAHSSANGEWVTAEMRPAQQLRLMGYPFNGDVTYEIAANDVTDSIRRMRAIEQTVVGKT